jgi:head-tail adaptor
MAIENLYNRTVDVLRRTVTTDSYGEQINAYSSHITGMECCLQGRSGNQSIVNNADRLRANYRLYCSNDNDIVLQDRIKDGSIYYDVIFINENLRTHHLQIDLEVSREYVNHG